MARLLRPFFERYTPKVARELLGCRLVRVTSAGRLSGTIVEAEAYRGSSDAASHAYKGKTARNSVMFGEAGHSYVYFTYGFHYCLNVTTEPKEKPGAVLIRASDPVEGLKEMVKNRGIENLHHLADGPGKLTRAMEIDMSLNGEDMVTSKRLFIEKRRESVKIGNGPRIGVTRATAYPWRLFTSRKTKPGRESESITTASLEDDFVGSSASLV